MIPALVLGVALACTGGQASRYDQPGHRMLLAAPTCRTLQAAPRVLDVYDAAVAVYEVAHEAGHAHDPAALEGCGTAGRCEAFADCYAAGHFERVGRLLGYPAAVARRLARVARAWTPSIGYSPIPAACWR